MLAVGPRSIWLAQSPVDFCTQKICSFIVVSRSGLRAELKGHRHFLFRRIIQTSTKAKYAS